MNAAALFLALWSLSEASPEARVEPGIDVLRDEGAPFLVGRRIGIITNPTGKTLDGVSVLRVLRGELGLSVVALFSPEHGFQGDAAAGDAIEEARERETGLPIYSLYGETRAPTPEMLSGVDVLVFDLQDAGVRFFTYASTMKLAMESAARGGIGFVVLDRPNPQGGLRVEGPLLEPGLESFVGPASIPLLHGMTLGELARLFRETTPGLADLDLRVVKMRGWERRMIWEDTGLPWRPPSPNLRTSRSALAYPAFGLMEGVEISEGRGTEETFEKIGAPWVDEAAYAEALNARRLPGVRFLPATFTPQSIPAAPEPRFRGELCRGVALEIADPAAFDPLRTGLAAIETLRSLYPRSFQWVKRGREYWIDVLLGSERPRLVLEAGAPLEAILDEATSSVRSFLLERERYLLY
ncbi:MAG TPA: DUF1343 domain-containing protein [Vicinamibacteria bacterium]|jgi:uncharacterized protein YbbC (DUF1343 family)